MASLTVPAPVEHRDSFDCFGGRAGVLLLGAGGEEAVAATRQRLDAWHHLLSRFDPGSELSLLNSSPRRRVRVSDVTCRFAAVAVDAAPRTPRLGDPALGRGNEDAGHPAGPRAPVPPPAS